MQPEDPAWFTSPPCDDEAESRSSGEAGAADEAKAHDRQKCAQAKHSTERVRLVIRAADDVTRQFRAVLCTLRRAIERKTGRLPDDAENPTTLCAFHHLRGVRGETVGVTGSAPDGRDFPSGGGG